MCLAVPAEIVEIRGNLGIANFGGLKKEINLEFLDDVKVGDFVIVHTGFAIQKMSREDAEESLKLFDQLFKENGS
jgi:hydrogenase expression/formation protein HypC